MAFEKEVLTNGRSNFTYTDDEIIAIYDKLTELKKSIKEKYLTLEKDCDALEEEAKAKEKAVWEAGDNDAISDEEYYKLEDEYDEVSGKQAALEYAVNDLQKIYDAIRYFVD